jgi:hypothetical protein
MRLPGDYRAFSKFANIAGKIAYNSGNIMLAVIVRTTQKDREKNGKI